MTSPNLCPWFTRENYNVIKRTVPGEPYLPDTYDEWLEKALHDLEKQQAAGIVVEKVSVNSEEFFAWCRKSGLDANTATLGAFITQKFWKQRKK